MTATLNVSVEFRREPNTHSVGEIYCSDGSYITPTLDWTNGTCTSIDLNGKTPIGIVVVPGSHTPDGTARIMSLLDCRLNSPYPTTSHDKIKWGYDYNFPSLRNYDVVPKLGGITVSNDSSAGTKWSYGDMTTLDSTSGLYYRSTATSKVPSVYLSEGDKNPDCFIGVNNRNVMNDFDGKGNTSIIISNATSDLYWMTGSITNSSNSGYFPAACACYRTVISGTQQRDWYLPSAPELVYVIYYLKLFNSILSKLKTLNSGSAVEIDTSGYWSSSEAGTYEGKYYIDFGNGSFRGVSTSSSLYVRPFLAVWG